MDYFRDLMRSIVKAENRQKRFKELGAPEMLIQKNEELLTDHRRHLWMYIEMETKGTDTDLALILDRLQKAETQTQCELRVKEKMEGTPITKLVDMLDDFARKELEKLDLIVIPKKGRLRSLEAFEEEERLVENALRRHLPELHRIREIAWDVYSGIEEMYFLQELEKIKREARK